MNKIILVVLLLFMVAGCGFTELYKQEETPLIDATGIICSSFPVLADFEKTCKTKEIGVNTNIATTLDCWKVLVKDRQTLELRGHYYTDGAHDQFVTLTTGFTEPVEVGDEALRSGNRLVFRSGNTVVEMKADGICDMEQLASAAKKLAARLQ